jgi:hypothetical protein
MDLNPPDNNKPEKKEPEQTTSSSAYEKFLEMTPEERLNFLNEVFYRCDNNGKPLIKNQKSLFEDLKDDVCNYPGVLFIGINWYWYKKYEDCCQGVIEEFYKILNEAAEGRAYFMYDDDALFLIRTINEVEADRIFNQVKIRFLAAPFSLKYPEDPVSSSVVNIPSPSLRYGYAEGKDFSSTKHLADLNLIANERDNKPDESLRERFNAPPGSYVVRFRLPAGWKIIKNQQLNKGDRNQRIPFCNSKKSLSA